MASLTYHCFAMHSLDSNVLKELCWDSTIVFMELNRPQQVSNFKSVITDFHLGEGFKAMNDAATVWVYNHSILINAILLMMFYTVLMI